MPPGYTNQCVSLIIAAAVWRLSPGQGVLEEGGQQGPEQGVSKLNRQVQLVGREGDWGK